MHPLVGHVADDDQIGVVDVAPLGNDEAEIQCVTLDAVGGVCVTPDPAIALRWVERDINTDIGDITTVGVKAIGHGPHADVGHVVEACGGRAIEMQRIDDVLSMRPRLHQRAVALDAGLMSGPNHGIRDEGSTVRSACTNLALSRLDHSSISAPLRPLPRSLTSCT